MSDAFCLPTGAPGRFAATAHSVGPWSGDLQHAGPPSALLARAVEEVPSRGAQALMVGRRTG